MTFFDAMTCPPALHVWCCCHSIALLFDMLKAIVIIAFIGERIVGDGSKHRWDKGGTAFKRQCHLGFLLGMFCQTVGHIKVNCMYNRNEWTQYIPVFIELADVRGTLPRNMMVSISMMK